MYPLFLTAIMTGMRRGELLALQRGDIDWHAGQIHVRRGLYKGRFITPPDRMIDWDKDLILARVELESLRQAPGWSSLDEGKLEAVEFWTSVVAREFINARRMISLRVSGDGSFISVERVPAGEYQFTAVFKTASMNRKLTVTPEDAQLPHVDVGDVELW
jgi:integrase